MPGTRVDYQELEESLQALAYSSRLHLLDLLRVPHTLSDIHLGPGPSRAGSDPRRPVSRQAIRQHLDKLVEAGLVVAREPTGRGRAVREYVVNPRRLYYVAEEFRKLCVAAASAPAGRDLTVDLDTPRPAEAREPGPKLVLAHGALEGKSFPLHPSQLAKGRGWVIGRKAGLHVSLGYDPYVSLENSEIVAEAGGYELLDLRTSRNGTSVNWRRLGKEERVALRPGDLIGVGRSLLVFRHD